jgi:hypothetical protein
MLIANVRNTKLQNLRGSRTHASQHNTSLRGVSRIPGVVASVQDIRWRRSEEKALVRFDRTRSVFQDQAWAQDISSTGSKDLSCNTPDGRVECDGET